LLILSAIGLAIVGIFWWQRTPGATTVRGEPAPPRIASQESSRLFAGTSSCSGQSCHGSLMPTDRPTSWQMEAALWIQRDPHARAYQVLFDPLAKEIASRLGLAGGAHEAPACLTCHTQPAAVSISKDPGEAASIRRERSMGVGCEGCHGNATRWLDAHLSKEWATRSAIDKFREHGLVPLGDPATLVKTCAGCHVGAPPGKDMPARDVNHDLIAAGHPRLAFEASAFLANLPVHWKPKRRNESQLWAVGQAVSAEAALELLKHRAREVWPEFAEYNCSACHHDLQASNRRQLLGRKGAMAWGTWYLSMPRWLAGDAGLKGTPALDALKRTMEKPLPQRAGLVEKIAAAIVEVRRLHAPAAAWDAGGPFALWKMQRLMKADGTASWDEAEQRYLALLALNQSAKDAGVSDRLRMLLDVRALPQGYTAPRGDFDPVEFARRLSAP